MANFWVIDAVSTAVDLDELEASAQRASSALIDLDRARARLGSTYSLVRSIAQSQVVINSTAPNAGVPGAVTEVLEICVPKLQALISSWTNYVDWVRIAGMLYALAEGDVQQLMQFNAIPLGSLASSFTVETNLLSVAFAADGALEDTNQGGLTSISGDLAISKLADLLGGDVAQAADLIASFWKQIEQFLANEEITGESIILRTPDGRLLSAEVGGTGLVQGLWEGVDVSALFAQTAGAPTQATRVTTPLSAAAVLARIGELRQDSDAGHVEILRHETVVDGETTRSWSVVIRGTQQWGFLECNPQDLLSNLQEVSGEASAARATVSAAMEAAGIQPGEAVELVGHSQGGIVAAAIAADASLASRYNIQSVLTAGSPTGTISSSAGSHSAATSSVSSKSATENFAAGSKLAGSTSAGTSTVKTVNLQNLADPVPALDGTVVATDGQVSVLFNGAELTDGKQMGAHSLDVYVAAAKELENSGSLSGFEENRQQALNLTEDTVTTSLKYDSIRIRNGSGD